MFRRGAPVVPLLVFALVAALSGCSTSSAGPIEPVEKPRIRIGLLPVVHVAGLHLAIKEGYFKQEGLTIELVTIQGAGAAIPDLVSANPKFDIVSGNYVSFFVSEANGEARDVGGLKFVADGYAAKPNTWMVMALPKSPAKKISDLPGKKVAVTTKASLAEVSIRSVLKVHDVDSSKVTFVEMPYTDMGPAMAAGQVDAALIAEPYLTDTAKKFGAVQLFDAAAGPTAELPIAGYGTTGKFARENPRTIAAFQRAIAKGQEQAGADRGKVEALLPDFAKIDRQTAALVTIGGFPTRLDAGRLQRIPDLMLEFGVLRQRTDAKTMILSNT